MAGMMLAILAAAAGPGAVPAASPVCGRLRDQWESADKELAAIHAEGVADDSAPRATMRAILVQNELTRAQILLAQMQSGHCQLPGSAPDWGDYSLPALECRKDLLGYKGGEFPPSCDRKTWKKAGE